MSDMTAGAVKRFTHYANATSELDAAIPAVVRAAQACEEVDLSFDIHAEQLYALYKLLAARRDLVEDQAKVVARQIGWQVATYEIAPLAREAEGPIVWITGNRYMPPLREYSVSETIWELDQGDAVVGPPDYWGSYVEALEHRLDELNVCMECPEYDNALYVVDLERFEHMDELRAYIVTSDLGKRHWWAEDAAHASEQHRDAFPDERILEISEPDDSLESEWRKR